MKREPFGGGREEDILVLSRIRKRQYLVTARVNLAGCTIGVVGDGCDQGAVAIPYWRGSVDCAADGGSVPPKRYVLVEDLYVALRQTDHELYTYHQRGAMDGIAKLYEALDRARQLYASLLGLSVQTLPVVAPRIRQLARAVLACVGPRPTDKLKQAVRDSALSVVQVLDSRHRVNPTAKLAQVVKIRQKLNRRLLAIQGIEPNLIRRQASIRLLIGEAERLFVSVSDYLHQFLSQLEVDPRCDGYARTQTEFFLRDFASSLERLDIDPFRNPCRRMAAELRKGADYLEVGRPRAARTVLRRAYESLKLRGIRSDAERFISYLAELLYQPKHLVTAAEALRIKRGLVNLLQRLGTVDEYRFIHPVSKAAWHHLGEAAKVVPLAGKPVSSLEALKRNLKLAAQLL
ncbi:MAG: hypothetical protein V1916_02930 [Patescibacteria group bacterium]